MGDSHSQTDDAQTTNHEGVFTVAVNGISVRISTGNRMAVNSAARRCARAYDDAEHVDRVGGRFAGAAVVWLSDDANGRTADMAPDGYTVDSTFISSAGNVAIRVSRDD